ncbi:MAG: hypothetical protein ABIH49_02640 [archaeon]
MEIIERKKSASTWIFLLYLVFGLYFLNFPFNLIAVPEVISQYNSWIIFLGGILIIFSSFGYLRKK